MSANTKKSIVRTALFTPYSKGRWGLPLFVFGEPGTGKSAVCEEVCQETGMPYYVLDPGAEGEAAFGVVPVPDGKGRLTFPRPMWSDLFVGEDGKDQTAGVLFIDDVTGSDSREIRAALLGLILERKLGAFRFPGSVRVIGAYNPPEFGCYELSTMAANRAGHYRWDPPTVEEHSAYMLGSHAGNGAVAPKANIAHTIEKAVMEVWPVAYAEARGLEAAFLRAMPHNKNRCPKTGEPAAGGAWASDRSWESATRALAGAKCHGLAQVDREVFVSAYIGAGVANEFFEFIEKQDLPNPADVLDRKSQWKHDKTRLDRTMAVVSSCVALVTPPSSQKRKDRANRLWEIMTESCSADPGCTDIFVPCAKALAEASLIGAGYGAASKVLAPVLRAASISLA